MVYFKQKWGSGCFCILQKCWDRTYYEEYGYWFVYKSIGYEINLTQIVGIKISSRKTNIIFRTTVKVN